MKLFNRFLLSLLLSVSALSPSFSQGVPFFFSTNDQVTPVDKTKTFTTLATFDENRYYINSLLHQHPYDAKIIIHTFADGVDHVSDPAKKISYRISTDKGQTWGSKATLYDPTDGTTQIQDPGLGIDHNGRLHIMADCHSNVGVTGATHTIRYMYSDDNGATVSSYVTIPFPSTSLASFRFYGRLIDTGTALIQPVYFATDEGDITQSERWILKSTDGGANWAWKLVEGPTSEYINESEVIDINNNVLFMMSRYESVKQYMMYKSTDAGETWIRVGPFGTGVAMTIAAPCRLHKFRSNTGKYYVEMVFPDKGTDKIYALYGKLKAGIVAGTGLFNNYTLTTLRTDASILHYGDLCHYNNNMNAVGAWPKELGTFPVDNQMIYFENLSTQYDAVSGILERNTEIYDALAQVSFIGSSSGMVTNTDNNYATVNASGQITNWKSILPGPQSQNFTATTGGITLTSDGVTFDGTKALSHNTSTYWNPYSYSSLGESDVNYTIWFKAKIGNTSNPNAFLGMVGNSAGSQSNKGMYLAYEDRASVPANDRFALAISKGTTGFIIQVANDNVVTPNVFHVIQVRVDLSEPVNNDKFKLEIDGTPITTTVAAYNTGVAAGPTYNMQIGNIGNSTAGGFFIGSIKEIVFQNIIDLPSVRTKFTADLMAIP